MIRKKTFIIPEVQVYALSQGNIVCTSGNGQLRSMNESWEDDWN